MSDDELNKDDFIPEEVELSDDLFDDDGLDDDLLGPVEKIDEDDEDDFVDSIERYG